MAMPNEPIVLAEHRRRRPARTLVYATLHDAIVRGELEPGRQLSENELATWLGVSRTPVREALVRLRDQRLVRIVPQLGTFVARISMSAVADAQFIREALECAAIRVGAMRITEDDVLALQDNLRAQERARDNGDHEAFYLLDDELHHALCDLSGRLEVWPMTQRAKAHLNRVRRLSVPIPTYLAEKVEEHRAIIDALATGDAEQAEEALRDHLGRVLSEVPSIRAKHPDYFEET